MNESLDLNGFHIVYMHVFLYLTVRFAHRAFNINNIIVFVTLEDMWFLIKKPFPRCDDSSY